MQTWSVEREIEKPKPSKARRLTVKNATSCLTVRALPSDGGVQVWLGLDSDSLPEYIIGMGQSSQDALGDAVELLEKVIASIQERRHPEDWEFDDGEL